MADKIFGVLGKKNMVNILHLLARDKKKYREVEKLLGNPSTTARHLKLLEEEGLIKREVSAERYRPVYYSLTSKGKKIQTLVKDMEEEYGDKA